MCSLHLLWVSHSSCHTQAHKPRDHKVARRGHLTPTGTETIRILLPCNLIWARRHLQHSKGEVRPGIRSMHFIIETDKAPGFLILSADYPQDSQNRREANCEDRLWCEIILHEVYHLWSSTVLNPHWTDLQCNLIWEIAYFMEFWIICNCFRSSTYWAQHIDWI